MTTSAESALGAVLSRVKKRVSRRDLALFAVCFLAVLGVHLYAFTNKLLNHDDLSELFGGGSLLASGRWLLNPVIKLTGRVSMPLLNGLVGSVFLALTILTVLRTLRIRRLVSAAAAALCMAAHPTVVCTWAYMFTAPAYFIAMFLAVLGVTLLRRPGWRWFAPGAALIGMSMGCYQAYLALAASLSVLTLILDILDGKHDGRWRPLLTDCLKNLAGLAAGLLLYFIVLRLCLGITGTKLVSYAGIDSMTDVSLPVLVKRVGRAYEYVFDFPESSVFSAVHRHFPAFLKLGSALSVLGGVWLACARRIWKKPLTLGILVVLAVLFPLAMGLVFVMADEANVHWLMVYPTVLWWLFPAAAGERIALPEKGRVRRAAAAVCALALLAVTAATGYEGALIANKVYLEMDLTRQSAQSYLARLFTRVEEQEGYTPQSKVALIGRADMVTHIPDEHLTGIFIGGDLLNIYSRGWLYVYTQGFSSAWVSGEEIEAIRATAEFAAMPVYPAAGSIQTINGVITVKLS